jgi:outer membrane protein OmpA-like peptidoglycan-associated protein
VRFRVEVVGHTDSTGGEEANLPLSTARAAYVASILETASGPRVEVVHRGVGSTVPVSGGTTDEDKQRNRRVSIHVTRLDGQG